MSKEKIVAVLGVHRMGLELAGEHEDALVRVELTHPMLSGVLYAEVPAKDANNFVKQVSNPTLSAFSEAVDITNQLMETLGVKK